MNRAALREDGIASGPLIVEDPDCTIVVLPGDRARIDDRGHLIIEIAPGDGG